MMNEAEEKALRDKIALLEKELKVVQRAYEELYQERYGDRPVVYAHVGGGKNVS